MNEISVVMSAYNAEATLPSTIDSILNQTFEEFELIVLNDGSTDRTRDILEHYSRTDPRIRVLHQENRGLTKALNAGLAMATGTYIARHDADDISLSRRFEKQVDYFRAHLAAVLVGCDGSMIDDTGNLIVTIRNSQKKRLSQRLVRSNPFIHGSIMFRRVVNGEHIRYNEFYQKAQDYDLILRLSEKGEIAIIPEVLYLWRFSRTGIVTSNVTFYGTRARDNYIRRIGGLVENFQPPTSQEVKLSPSEAHYNYALGIRYLSGYRTREARHSFLKALKALRGRDRLLMPCLKLLFISFVPVFLLKHLRDG